MKTISKYIVNKMLCYNVIKEKDYQIYLFGVVNAISISINLTTALIIGIISNKLLTISIFLLFFVPLRTFAGGYHSNNRYKCYILSNVAILIIATYSSYFNTMLIILLIPSLFIIYRLAPIENKNRILDKKEILIFGRMVHFILPFEISIMLFCLLFKYYTASYIIILAIESVAILLLIGFLSLSKNNVID